MQRTLVGAVAGSILLLAMMVLPSACQALPTSIVPTVAPGTTAPGVVETPGVARAQPVEQAVQQVDFQVKVPAWLPFKPARSYAFVVPIGGNRYVYPEGSTKALEITYVSPSGDSITLQLKGEVTDIHTRGQQTAQLAGGIQAQYQDNGTAQILNWQDGEFFYSISGIGEATYTPDQLTRVANSLEPASSSSAVQVTKEILVTEVAPGPSPTPIACTPLPEGMALHVEALSPTAAQVELTGLQPGEHPTVIFSAEVPRQGSAKLESRDAEPIGSDGRFVDRESGLYPISASVENRWAVKIVHARGVACTEVLLPPALVGTPAEPVRLADGSMLERYLLSAVGLIPEKPLLVTLHWRGAQPPADDVVILRLRSPDGRLWPEVGRSHTPHVVGHFAPTTQHWLELPAGAPGGVYRVEIVVKDPATGEETTTELFPVSVLQAYQGGLVAGRVSDFPPGSVTLLKLEGTVYDWDPYAGEPATSQERWPDTPDAPQPVAPVPIYLVHDAEAGFLALYRRDPFRGCDVQWRPAEELFIDPCLGSHYGRRGAYRRGPSGRGLDRFETTVTTSRGETYVEVDLSYLIPGPPPGRTVPLVIEPLPTPTPAQAGAPAATP